MALAISFALTGCKDDYPDIHPKLIDFDRGRFLNHELVDRQNVTFKATSWEKGLYKLDAHYCISAEEIGALNDWARRRGAKNIEIEGDLQ